MYVYIAVNYTSSKMNRYLHFLSVFLIFSIELKNKNYCFSYSYYLVLSFRSYRVANCSSCSIKGS